MNKTERLLIDKDYITFDKEAEIEQWTKIRFTY